MLAKNLTLRCVVAFLAVDALFNPLLMVAYLAMMRIGSPGAALGVSLLLIAVKSAVGSAFLVLELKSYERVAERTSGRDELLVDADRALQGLPRRFAVFYASAWAVLYALVFLSLDHFNPGAMSARALDAALLASGAVWCGAFAVSFPLVVLLTAQAASACSVRARHRGVTLERDPIAIKWRIGVVALALALGPTLWMAALGYMKGVQAASDQRAALSALAAAELAAAPDERSAGERWAQDFQRRHAASGAEVVAVAVTDASLEPPARRSGPDPLAPARDWLKGVRPNVEAGVWSPRDRDVSVAFHRHGASRAAVIMLRTPDGAPRDFVLSAGVFALVIAVWAPLCAGILGHAVSAPIERLAHAAREIVEQGKQSEMEALPVARADEIGGLTDRFNDLLDLMRDLSVAADAIAKGDLRVEIQGKGELPDAFRHMLGSLRGMVHQIGETSVELGSAATEIFAASQEQEAAAASQSSAMEEISRTMDSLSASAAHVSDAVRGVLSNAERTLDNTDAMVKRIADLSAHASRIAEILEVIREIADKSDLLALNGSLEANRAGEQGHGFALVAAEMRRLAERVTASVQDVKRLVTDIRESGSTTVMATEESRRLAQGTTEAARQITFVTQQQRSGTEQVSQSVKGIADVVTQAVSATAQTRTSAERLKAQADRLTALVRRFETTTGQAA
jgi:methyl-accepting chemotaxis protein